jgi:hypothetical protein
MRVVAHGEKWCDPQPVRKKSASLAPASGPNMFEKRFWSFACGVVLLWIFLRVFDFTLLPPAYNGLLITQPFCGLHSWASANGAWAARSHVKYGFGYTKGLPTLVAGDPPPLIPEYYVSHPPLETWIVASGMLVFGGGLTREAQHGVTFASRSVVYLVVYLWGRCPPTPGIFRFGPEAGREEKATLDRHHIASCPWAGAALGLGPQTRYIAFGNPCFPAAPYPPLRHGQDIKDRNGSQGLSGRPGVEDLQGRLEAAALPWPMGTDKIDVRQEAGV